MDEYKLNQLENASTSLNLMTYCKVTEISTSMLKLEGDGFKLALKYNPESVIPKIEFFEVTDAKLKSYWPNGVTRIVFEIKNQALKGKNELVFTEIK